jgi:hypothetical protein
MRHRGCSSGFVVPFGRQAGNRRLGRTCLPACTEPKAIIDVLTALRASRLRSQ